LPIAAVQVVVGIWNIRIPEVLNLITNVPEEISREVTSSEHVLWAGQPKQGVVFRGSDAFLIPFSLLWGGFAFFWEASVLQAPTAPGFFPLFGIPFVCVGIYLIVGRFFADAKQRSRTFYAITNERILIISGLFSRRVKSLNLRTLADLSISEGSNGEGSISFGGGSPFGSMFGSMPGWPGSEVYVGPRFDVIPSAKAVFDIIRNAQRASS
jgi:hypothetical protein